MRHVFASRPVSARALGMPEPPSAAGLVTGARRALATPACMRAAISGAVNLAAIATTANQRLDPTPNAQKKPGRSSVGMVGLADAMWTNARLSAILIGHACPARCGARRRAEPPKSRSAPCLPSRRPSLPQHRRPRQGAPRAAASTSATHHQSSRQLPGIRCQAHNRAIYARIFTAIDKWRFLTDIMPLAVSR
jgi:hypothetical protein